MVSTKPRVFADTNVLFSAAYSATGPPAELLGMHVEGTIQLVISPRVINEIVRELTAKLPGTAPLLVAAMIGTPPAVVADPSRRDVDAAARNINLRDAPIFAAALTAEIDYFVTGDRRFLGEARAAQPPFAVVTPRELLDRLEQSP
jgi:predicted nucleic acid-binding protein